MNHKLIPQAIIVLFMMVMFKNQQLKNKWFPYFKPEDAVSVYQKVALDGLFIDGEDRLNIQSSVYLDLKSYGNLLRLYGSSGYKFLE